MEPSGTRSQTSRASWAKTNWMREKKESEGSDAAKPRRHLDQSSYGASGGNRFVFRTDPDLTRIFGRFAGSEALEEKLFNQHSGVKGRQIVPKSFYPLPVEPDPHRWPHRRDRQNNYSRILTLSLPSGHKTLIDHHRPTRGDGNLEQVAPLLAAVRRLDQKVSRVPGGDFDPALHLTTIHLL